MDNAQLKQKKYTQFLPLTGFTLIELLITLVVLGILLAIAYPSFTQSIANNRVRSQAQEIISLLSFARAEAISRGVTVTVFNDPKNLESWNAGGAVRVGGITIFQIAPMVGSQVTSVAGQYQFDSRGIASSAAAISVKDHYASQIATVSVSAGGAISLTFTAATKGSGSDKIKAEDEDTEKKVIEKITINESDDKTV